LDFQQEGLVASYLYLRVLRFTYKEIPEAKHVKLFIVYTIASDGTAALFVYKDYLRIKVKHCLVLDFPHKHTNQNFTASTDIYQEIP